MKTKMKIEMEIWRWIIFFLTSFIGMWTIIYKLFEGLL